MRIRALSLFAADLPLADPFQHASSGRIDVLKDVVLKIEADDGGIGYGEVRGNIHYVTGDSAGRICAAFEDLYVPALLGADASSPRRIADLIGKSIAGNTSVRALIDSAVHDLVGKALGVPVYRLLGGRTQDVIRPHVALPFCSPDEAAGIARDYLDRGFRLIKLRVGLTPFALDIARAEAVGAAIAAHPAAAETTLGADANQAWQPKDAILRIRRLQTLGVSFIEQPVGAGDIIGMRDVRRAVDIPVFADESCGTPQDLLRLIREEAADGFHFKLCKAGGILNLMKMVAVAEAAERPYIVGQMDEGMLATAAAIHCGLASRAKSYELWGFERVGSQPFTGISVENAALHVPERPGLGVEVDEARLVPLRRWTA